VILDDRALGRRFASGRRIPEILRALAVDMGAVPIADYAWEIHGADGAVVRVVCPLNAGAAAVTSRGSPDGWRADDHSPARLPR
jgi:hypothetical protein